MTGNETYTRLHMKRSLHPTLLAVFPSVAYRALADVRVPLVDACATVLAPVGFTIVSLCCTA